MHLDIRPEIAPGLTALASAQGLSVEDYLQRLAARELPAIALDDPAFSKSGMVLENGLMVYKTGKPLPAHIVGDGVAQSRAERSEHILGSDS